MSAALLLPLLLALLPAALTPAPAPCQEESAEAAAKVEAGLLPVRIETSLGDMVFGLHYERTPLTVANFVEYAEDDFYDGTIFHRVISNFMAQGGGYTAELERKPTRASIPNEADRGGRNLRGTIAMARLTEPHTATSQFFVNLADNAFLDHQAPVDGGWGYAVFGRLLEGEETLAAIRDVPVELQPKVGSEQAFPTTPVVIEDVVILDAERAEAAKRAAAAAIEERQAAARERAQRDELQLEQALAFVREQGADTSGARTQPSGLTVIDVVEGGGRSPSATDIVAVDYTLWLAANGREVAGSAPGQPLRIGLNQVIPGWTEGVTSMKEGGERWLIVPPHLGYGESGRPGLQGGATLVFRIKLQKVGG